MTFLWDELGETDGAVLGAGHEIEVACIRGEFERALEVQRRLAEAASGATPQLWASAIGYYVEAMRLSGTANRELEFHAAHRGMKAIDALPSEHHGCLDVSLLRAFFRWRVFALAPLIRTQPNEARAVRVAEDAFRELMRCRKAASESALPSELKERLSRLPPWQQRYLRGLGIGPILQRARLELGARPSIANSPCYIREQLDREMGFAIMGEYSSFDEFMRDVFRGPTDSREVAASARATVREWAMTDAGSEILGHAEQLMATTSSESRSRASQAMSEATLSCLLELLPEVSRFGEDCLAEARTHMNAQALCRLAEGVYRPALAEYVVLMSAGTHGPPEPNVRGMALGQLVNHARRDWSRRLPNPPFRLLDSDLVTIRNSVSHRKHEIDSAGNVTFVDRKNRLGPYDADTLATLTATKTEFVFALVRGVWCLEHPELLRGLLSGELQPGETP